MVLLGVACHVRSEVWEAKWLGCSIFLTDRQNHIFIHVCGYIQTYIYACTTAHTHAETYMCMHTCGNIHTYMCFYAHVYIIMMNKSPQKHLYGSINSAPRFCKRFRVLTTDFAYIFTVAGRTEEINRKNRYTIRTHPNRPILGSFELIGSGSVFDSGGKPKTDQVRFYSNISKISDPTRPL